MSPPISEEEVFESAKPSTREDEKEEVKPLETREAGRMIKKEIEGLRDEEVLEGEQPCMNTLAIFTKEEHKFNGRLIMTNYRVVFVPDDNSVYALLRLKDNFFDIPIGFIAK
eukprot:TRINITY_DN4376_c0_g1_i10.p3 TRINITY_DN4376_c0_g1~~TRINITY_DN4376_c0_g1_i10.p3  ORF type:complete len:112 (-),score=40.64 TRINITY_DN4376_c0_g1_i10:143-478(-)